MVVLQPLLLLLLLPLLLLLLLPQTNISIAVAAAAAVFFGSTCSGQLFLALVVSQPTGGVIMLPAGLT
jgi:hypothetical protein